MTKSKQKKGGCGCCSIPISVLILGLGLGIWGWTKLHDLGVPQAVLSYAVQQIPLEDFLPDFIPLASPTDPPIVNASPSPQATAPSTILSPIPAVTTSPTSPRQQEQNLRGIYISRYQITNNASEQMIRERVRYYRSKGINTIIHGVWGNACTMYPSEVMAKTFNSRSCPNQFQDQWLDWLIDEAHKQGMEVHAYFEKGIKIDEDSPLFDLAVQRRWIVAGVDRTHPGVDHYVLDVSVPEVAQYMTDILVEFVQKYPQIDAVQWDDYLGYHAELPGQVDRTEKLTNFVQNMIEAMREANPNVSFDLAHHNPYWAKQYFAADWENWDIDRAFIQVYAEENFQDEMKYVEASNGIAITERQFNQLENLVKNPRVESILLFPLSGKPEEMAATYYDLVQGF